MSRTSFVMMSALGIIACKHGTEDVDDVCTPLPTELCNPPGATTTETGGDESGDDESGGDESGGEESGGGGTGVPTELGPDECVHNVTPGVTGYRMQCEGELFTTLEFNLPLGKDCESSLGIEFCSQHYVFGPSNDTYDAPDVMACCGEAWDHEYADVYLEHCIDDLIQQVCFSLAKRLESYVLDGTFGIHASQRDPRCKSGWLKIIWIASRHYFTTTVTPTQARSNPHGKSRTAPHGMQSRT